jgi:hypothetical protein
MSLTEVAKETGLNWRTVSKYLSADGPASPRRFSRRKAARHADAPASPAPPRRPASASAGPGAHSVDTTCLVGASDGLQPGDLGQRLGLPARVQVVGIDARQDAPGGRGGGDRAEHVALVAQHRPRNASPLSASITARSTAMRPGSCPVPRGRSRCRASLKALVSGVASARFASRREPAWLTTPCPSALTTSLGRDRIVCTQNAENAFLLVRLGP